MAANLKQVAELSGVSVRTVSNVVNGFHYVAPETRQRVQTAIDALGYRPNAAARSLRTGRTGLLALVVPALDQPYFAELARAVVRHANAAGYTVVLDQTDADRERELDLLSGQPGRTMFDGLILNPLTLTSADIPANPSRPIVLLGERAIATSADHVHIDNVAAARTATEHLIAGGRRRVAVIGTQDTPSGQSARLRLQGAMIALAEAGLTAHPDLLRPADSYTRTAGYRAMEAILDGGRAVDAVFCFNDSMAIGALRALREHSVRVPDDVAVVGFDDIEEGQFSAPPLTTVRPDKDAIARTAVERLVARIGGESEPGQEIEVGFDLVVRESTTGP
ncbi:MAG: LacI family transcriptional regulator [Actinobacteria bacterium]|nr:LacI family transcriptional regulator [Actinomycetota bacterium]